MDGSSPEDHVSPRLNPKRITPLRASIAMVGALVAVSALSLWVGSRIRSPEQAAADAAPPIPSVITASVERRTLTQQLTLRGTGVVDGVAVVARAEDSVLPAIVTDVRMTNGAILACGDVPLVVAGRPVIVMKGDLPMYRDLVPGSVGPDVAQLQQVLADLGYRSDDPDDVGTFGPATQDLVRQLYEHLGFAPALTSQDAFVIIADSNRAVEDAKDAVSSAKATRSRAMTSSDRADANIALAQAQRSLEAAQQGALLAVQRNGVMVPYSEVVFVPSTTSTVTNLNAVVGRTPPASGVLAILATGTPQVEIQISETHRPLVDVGTEATIVDPISGTRYTASVISIELAAATETTTGPTHVGILALHEAVSFDVVGGDLQVVITTAATDGEVLVVPVAAVSGHADGRTTVSVVRHGAPTVTEVVAGLSAGGFVEVSPREEGGLRVGEQVVVGADPGSR